MSTPKRAKSERRRSPRYQLRGHDVTTARFKTLFKPSRSRVSETEVIDISETGISFRIRESRAPRLGDVLAVEFRIPGGQQIACKAMVVRLEQIKDPNSGLRWNERSYDQVLAGLQFLDLPAAYKRTLSQRVTDRMNLATPAARERWDFRIDLPTSQIAKVLKWTAVTILSVGLLVAFVAYMQRLSESKWWLKDAQEFYKESKRHPSRD